MISSKQVFTYFIRHFLLVSLCMIAIISAPIFGLFPKAHAATCDTSVNDPTGIDTASGGNWADVNRWDAQVKAAIVEIGNVEGVCVPGNFIKSDMMTESQGNPNAVSPDGYLGLMQVAGPDGAGGGSNCDTQKYNIHEVQGNVNCGTQEQARGYKSCGSWEGALAKYFSGSCAISEKSDGNNTVQQYVSTVMNRWKAMGGPVNEGAGSSGGGSFGSIAPLSLVLKPKTNDTYVINVATADVVGAMAPGGSSDSSLNPDATGFLKAAQDVMAAYQKCEPPGTTFDKPGLSDCLAGELVSKKYSTQQVTAFQTRLPSSQVPLSSGGLPCSQCLGYIGITAALWGGTADANQTLGNIDTAGSVNDNYSKTGFSLAGHKFTPIGSGVSAKIQTGDIAVAGTAFNGDHIAIVFKPIDDTHMQLLESNGGYDCKITNDRQTAKDAYTFYRQQ